MLENHVALVKYRKNENNGKLLRRLTTMYYRKFSGDESFLKDPNAFNDAKNAAAVQVVDEPISEVSEKAEDKSRL